MSKLGAVPAPTFNSLVEAALDREPVSGWTHNFYRYPARFSPRFAAAVIEHFSRPGDVVLDPYMGGGTAVVEGVAAGRYVIGNDLNSLAAFVAKVKVTPLTRREVDEIRHWIRQDVPRFSYRLPAARLAHFIDHQKTENLSLARARFIKKATAAALVSISDLHSANARRFATGALLRVAQWALDGRSRHTSLVSFRRKLATTAEEMLTQIDSLSRHMKERGGRAVIHNQDARLLPEVMDRGRQAALVVTSPPYPGVHVLYHRWQVDGRRETPAPYWITGCNDGNGASFYNFADRRAPASKYFSASLLTLEAIRRVMREGAYMVQLIAFNRPKEQLPKYLDNMSLSGFAEVPSFSEQRIWRDVPNRKWHARLRGKTHSSREVVLVHRAV